MSRIPLNSATRTGHRASNPRLRPPFTRFALALAATSWIACSSDGTSDTTPTPSGGPSPVASPGTTTPQPEPSAVTPAEGVPAGTAPDQQPSFPTPGTVAPVVPGTPSGEQPVPSTPASATQTPPADSPVVPTSAPAEPTATPTGPEPAVPTSPTVPTTPVDDAPENPLQGKRLGWNLGNSLDAPEGETSWGNPMVSEALIDAVAQAGFEVVRIPVTWSLYLGAGPEFTIDPTWLARVDEVVGYVTERNMAAIINLHHDGADNYEGVEWITLNAADGSISEANNAAVEAQFVAVWTQIAAHFAGHSHRLVFESMNEIHDGYDTPPAEYHQIINALNQRFVDLIRQSGGNNATRTLVVPGYNTNIDHTLTGFVLPTDSVPNKLVLSVHYYDPWSFAGEGSNPVWGAAYPGADEWGQEAYVDEQFGKLKSTYVDQGVPVLIGEYGAVRTASNTEYRRYYLEYVTKAAVDRGLLPVYWDNGGLGEGMDSFGIFDRSTNQVAFPEVLETLLRAATSDYTSADIARP